MTASFLLSSWQATIEDITASAEKVKAVVNFLGTICFIVRISLMAKLSGQCKRHIRFDLSFRKLLDCSVKSELREPLKLLF